ncbi:hypothetical protein ITJ86_15285 [Winogradskyella sp. F6397]|uniref:DUF1735 domain-containing protein n=1 Tax=Winogradskyella marina TaxID=2785530 RepID=A0ABS0ER67_9FLAO|nr:hypothetical protein [Winogradskyella marina]MBF8151271.1 hypothetical protein [Winogradskyella marina]
MKTKLFILLVLFVSIYSSCEEPNLSNETIDGSSDLYAKSNKSYELKKKFALALHEAMTNNVKLRQFLKTEALKKFNGDYDILYNYVRDNSIGNSTFRDVLKSYYDDESDLVAIEENIPTLTIFIPSLPKGSFSAENWDVSIDVPLVAISLLDSDKTPLISSNSQSYLLDHNVIPGFPVVVVKENERIAVPSHPQYKSLTTTEYLANNGYKFKFSHNIFNFINPPIDIVIDGTPDYIVDAWEVYGENQNLGWHRDFIYYTLQPSVPNGPYINDYSEFLRDFKIEGTGEQALAAIADVSPVNNNLDDPELKGIVVNPSNINQGSFWTDGSFEFEVNINYDTDTPILEKGFPADPEDLFEIEYQKHGVFWLDFYVVTNIETKTYRLDLELLPWQIHNVSNQWQLEFQEVDLTVEETTEETYTSKYNTNFGFESNELWKFGLELGGSSETTQTSQKTRKYKLESNDLNQSIVKFEDNVIIDENELGLFHFNYQWYDLRRYTTGECSFSLIPLKVQ